MKGSFGRQLKRLLGYFAQGLLVGVPVAAVIFVFYKGFVLVDNLIPIEEDEKFPGMGILVLLVLITALGFLANTIIAKPIVKYFNGLLNKMPLVKTIYGAIKDLMSAFVGKEKKFNRPVLVKMFGSESGLEKLGFITEEDLSEIGIKNDKIAVYLPHSYNFSGNLYIVPRSHIVPVEASAADIMKFIVSGGVTELDHKNEND